MYNNNCKRRATYFRRTELAEFDDAMRQSESRSERERRVTIELSDRVDEGGVQLATMRAVAAAARQTDHRRRHRRTCSVT